MDAAPGATAAELGAGGHGEEAGEGAVEEARTLRAGDSSPEDGDLAIVGATEAAPIERSAPPANTSAIPASELPFPGLPPPEELLSGIPTFAMSPCAEGIPRRTNT